MEINPQDIEQDDVVGDMLIRLLSGKVVDDLNATKAERKDGVPQMLLSDFSAEEIIYVCQQAEKSFMRQDVLVEIDKGILPLYVVADLHGQIGHALRLFRSLGSPQRETYLFLGDYVDRGVQGIELMLLLFCCKIRYPFQVFLLRGNHEDVNTNLNYGFYEECLVRFNLPRDPYLGEKVWIAFLSAFNCMPLAAVISGKRGRLLCCHGGISPFINNLEDINKIQRPTIIPAFGAACDLVWSDPGPLAGWALSHRGISFTFGTDVLEKFCQKHNLELVLRGHQINEKMYRSGYKMNPGGRLVTFFSAPNYMNYRNNGCVVKVADGLRLSFLVFRVKATEPLPKRKTPFSNLLRRKSTLKTMKKIPDVRDREGEIDTEVDIANSKESLVEDRHKNTRNMEQQKSKSLYYSPGTNKSSYLTKNSNQNNSFMGSSYQPTLSSYGQPTDKGYFDVGKSQMAPVNKSQLSPAAGAKQQKDAKIRKKDSKR